MSKSDITFEINSGVFNFRVAGIIRSGSRYLLHKFKNDKFWTLAGGRVKAFEESKEALKREMFEELGIKVEVGNLKCSSENFFKHNGKDFHEIVLIYNINIIGEISSEKEFCGQESNELIYKWFEASEFEMIGLEPKFLAEILISDDERIHIIQKD